MVVTSSRQHALDLYQAIRTYVAEPGHADLGVLVAFSGQLKDDAGLEFTEAQLNGFPESRLPEMFGYTKVDDPQAAARGQDEYRLLVAAEKYQTGFDQPLLCAMYVDKPLTGVTAVQTLSRLNRIHPLKAQDDVHILDFVNQATDIPTAFEDWFETTITEPSDPNLLYDKQRQVMDYGLLAASEMEAFIRVLATDDQRDGFRSALQNFVRAYSLIAQIVDWGDPDLERLYQYGRVLLIRLPGRPSASVDIGDADLSHFRLEATSAWTGRWRSSCSAALGIGPGRPGQPRGRRDLRCTGPRPQAFPARDPHHRPTGAPRHAGRLRHRRGDRSRREHAAVARHAAVAWLDPGSRARPGGLHRSAAEPGLGGAIAAQIAAVLADVHRVDIVHRDIKPANVMLVDGGLVKVLDFGIAILRGAGALPRLTQVDRTVGTPAYMSPEQGIGQVVTAASDVYSLGCLLCDLLTADPPFHGTADISLRARHLQSPAPSIRERRADVSADVDALVAAMLAKEPHVRPSAEAVYDALVPLSSQADDTAGDEDRDPTRPFRRPLLSPPPRRRQLGRSCRWLARSTAVNSTLPNIFGAPNVGNV
ncbi:MAG: protein kinase domain-containing protein, partial [Pseudonocardiaceae bacterium]